MSADPHPAQGIRLAVKVAGVVCVGRNTEGAAGMAKKQLPVADRLKTPVTVMVPFRVREQLDQLVKTGEGSSLNELGNRAFAEYLEKHDA